MTNHEYNARQAKRAMERAERTLYDPNASGSDALACGAFLLLIGGVAVLYYAGLFAACIVYLGYLVLKALLS